MLIMVIVNAKYDYDDALIGINDEDADKWGWSFSFFVKKRLSSMGNVSVGVSHG
jgi:hypothetical protein